MGKLASAIQNRDDVDITVKVRMDLDGPFGAPGTGSLMTGQTATITEVKDDNGVSTFIWGKLDRPDIFVNGDFGEAYEANTDYTSSLDSPDVITPTPPDSPPDTPTNTPASESPITSNVSYGR